MTPREAVARTIWGEARGEGEPGMTAVANVIVNRAAKPGWWGSDIVSVCVKPWQFSCWNSNDPNRAKLLNVTPADQQYTDALAIASEAVAGVLNDNVNGATTYKTTKLPWPRAWGPEVAPVAIVGHQSFYILP